MNAVSPRVRQSVSLGVSADRTIRFWRREPSGERWLAIDDDVLGVRVLPEPLLATPLSYAGQRVAANTIVPFRASGRNEPFTFMLASPTWLVVLAVVFVAPYMLLMSEVGSAFTQEGGPYEWSKMAFGRLSGGE